MDSPAMKDQIEKATIEPKHGYCSGVCQNCSHTISEFYQNSQKVCQNQEVLNGNIMNRDQAKDPKISLQCIKQEPLNDSELPETIEDAHKLENEVSEAEEAPILDPKIPLDCVKNEPLNDFGFPETIGDANEPNSEASEEETPILGSKISQENGKLQTPSYSAMMETNQDACEFIDEALEVEEVVHTLHSEITLEDFKIEITDSDLPQMIDEEKEIPILDSKITIESGKYETSNEADLLESTEKIVIRKPKNRKEEDELFKKHIKMVCDFCGISADSYKALFRHFKEDHKRTKGYVMCCNRKLFDRYHIREHINVHENPDMFRCEVCEFNFKNQHSMNVHMLKKHPQTHKCELCPKSFAEESALTEHKKLHLKCPKCKKVCTKQSIHKHMYSNHGVRKIICDICKKKFVTIKCLDQHKKMHSQSSATETNLNHKTKNRHATNELQCDKCPRKFPHPPALSLHKRRLHSEPKHVCEYCDKKFRRAYVLKEHLATHIGEVLYTCEHCEVSDNSSVVMYMHMRRHHPEEWAQKKLMKTKRTDSTDEFLCDNCPRKFKNYKTFYAHKLYWHTEPKHECEHCGLKFKKAFLLKDHLAATHTGKGLHTCEHCGKSYASRKNMVFHIKSHHPAEWEQKKLMENMRVNSSKK